MTRGADDTSLPHGHGITHNRSAGWRANEADQSIVTTCRFGHSRVPRVACHVSGLLYLYNQMQGIRAAHNTTSTGSIGDHITTLEPRCEADSGDSFGIYIAYFEVSLAPGQAPNAIT